MAKLNIVKWTLQGWVSMDKLLDQYKWINFPADENKCLESSTRQNPTHQNIQKSDTDRQTWQSYIDRHIHRDRQTDREKERETWHVPGCSSKKLQWRTQQLQTSCTLWQRLGQRRRWQSVAVHASPTAQMLLTRTIYTVLLFIHHSMMPWLHVK